MTAVLVQRVAVTYTADEATIGPGVNGAPTITTTSGNALVIAVAGRNATNPVTGVTDSAGNAWAQILNISIASGMTLSIWRTTAASPTGLSSGTITATVATSTTIAAEVFEISGANNAALVDQSASAANVSSTAIASGATAALAAANELALGILAFAAVRTLSATPAFTQGAEGTSYPSATGIDSSTGSSQTNMHAGTLAITTTAGQSYTATLSSASAWCAATLVIASAAAVTGQLVGVN